MIPVLEAVPNLSAGRDAGLLDEAVRRIEAAGVDVVDRSADPDHNRAVLTLFGAPERVEDAGVALAAFARDAIDLREHRGAHPRVGALDVFPVVPLSGIGMADAIASARRIGRRIADEVGVPVWFYAEASDPPGRTLAELRSGGFESLVRGVPADRIPDLSPSGGSMPSVHSTAGGVCVGARPLLLAWNVDVAGIALPDLRRLASELRERNGGIPGLRTLALDLPRQRRTQLSMNLEDAGSRDPFAVFRVLEERIRAMGGEPVRTEIVGLAPDGLLSAAAADRLATLDRTPLPVLSSLLTGHLSRRAAGAARAVVEAFRDAPGPHPAPLREAVAALEVELLNPHHRESTE